MNYISFKNLIIPVCQIEYAVICDDLKIKIKTHSDIIYCDCNNIYETENIFETIRKAIKKTK